MVDADTTYSALDIQTLLLPLLNHEVDMVVGNRHSAGEYSGQNERRYHVFGNSLIKNLVNLFFNVRLNDILSGYRAFNRHFVKTYPVMAKGFEVELDMTLHALDKRFSVIEVPVSYRKRPENSHSKLHTIKDGTKIVYSIFNLLRYYRPMVFFGAIAIFILCCGLFVGIPVIKEFYITGYVSKLPSAVLSSSMVLLSVITGAVGLILDSIVYIERQNFERNSLEIINGKF